MAWDITPACADVQIVSRAGSEVRSVPKRKKVACVGFASNTLHLVPWDDPDFEIWGMNQGHMNFRRRADRWFEMHLPEYTADARDPEYLTFLKNLTIPIYMIEERVEAPTSLRYPIEHAIQYVGRDYFMSTVSFMLVLAAMEEFEEIHLYGINLAIGDEYFYEKPNCEYLIGMLQGRGIKVIVPQASSLLKQWKRYGYHPDARPNQSWKLLLNSRIQQYRSQIEQVQVKANAVSGHIECAKEVLALPEGTDMRAHLQQKIDTLSPEFQMSQMQGNQYLGAMRESEALIQIAEGMDAGADLVLMPAPPAPTTTSS